MDTDEIGRLASRLSTERLPGRESQVIWQLLGRSLTPAAAGPLTTAELAKRCHLNESAARHAVANLQRKRLVRRRGRGERSHLAITVDAREPRLAGADLRAPSENSEPPALEPGPEAEPEHAPSGNSEAGPTELELLREQAEAARAAPLPPASEEVVDLVRLASGDGEVERLATRLEASGEIGRELLRRLVGELRDAPRASDGRLLTANGALPVRDVALDELRKRLTVARQF